jgi:hypothetical protein
LCAEVAFFLKPLTDPSSSTGAQLTTTGPTPTPLYGLYMRQRVAADSGTTSGSLSITNADPSQYHEISGQIADPATGAPPAVPFASAGPFPCTLTCNNPGDLTQPPLRFDMDPRHPPQAGAQANYLAGLFIPDAGLGYGNFYTTLTQESSSSQTYAGSDLLLNNVVSFEVRVLLAGPTTVAAANDTQGAEFVDLFDPTVQAFTMGNPAFYDATNNATGPAVFDTWSQNTAGNYVYSPGWNTRGWGTATAATIPIYQDSSGNSIIIKAIQVTLRVWDEKAQLTRQVTIIVPQ